MPSGIYDNRKRKGVFAKGSIPWNKGITGYTTSLAGHKRPDMIGNKLTLGRSPWNKGTKRPEMSGEKNHNWKGGVYNRDIHSLNNPEYRDWRTKVFIRDSFICKMKNNDCKGGIEAHHILRWSEFVELRYEVNNGITLCHFHHPRKRKDEEKLSPYFKDLIANW